MTKKPTIQQKIDELNKMLEWFNGDDFVLEDALDKYKEMEKLAKDINSDLDSIKNEVNIIKKKFDN
jgi:exonuclease VII small subunit